MAVTELGRQGFTPKVFAAIQKLHKELNEAIDHAEEAKVPMEMVIGMFECTKAAILDAYFRDMEPPIDD